MSPVAPHRQRSARTYTLALGGVLLGLALAVGLFVFAIPTISSHNQTVLKLGAADFDAGSAKDRAADIARSGPILLPDQSGGLSATSTSSTSARTRTPAGWPSTPARPARAASARSSGTPGPVTSTTRAAGPRCRRRDRGLVHYRVTVTKDGRVVVDLNPNDETAGLPSGGTTTVPTQHHVHRPHHRHRAQGLRRRRPPGRSRWTDATRMPKAPAGRLADRRAKQSEQGQQLALGQLVGAGAGQLVHGHEAARHLVVRQVLVRPRPPGPAGRGRPRRPGARRPPGSRPWSGRAGRARPPRAPRGGAPAPPAPRGRTRSSRRA